MSRYKDVIVVKNGIRYVVRGHAIYRAVDRSLFRADRKCRESADQLVDLLILNQENIRTEYEHKPDIFIQIEINPLSQIKGHILTILQKYEGKMVIITSTWTQQIYKDKIRNQYCSKRAIEDITGLTSRPSYFKV